MKSRITSIILAAILLGLTAGAREAPAAQRLGVGGHYWSSVSAIDVNDIDENGYSWIISYQYRPAGLLGFEADLEIYPSDYVGLNQGAYAPQAWVLVGGTIYAGLGAGIYYSDSRFADAPFYVVRAGLDLALLPGIFLDINANYRFEEWGHLNDIRGDISTDTVTLGATLRFEF
jgi:hypothetical protein